MQSAITALRNHPYLFLLTQHPLHHRTLAAWAPLAELVATPFRSLQPSLTPPNSDKPDTPAPRGRGEILPRSSLWGIQAAGGLVGCC